VSISPGAFLDGPPSITKYVLDTALTENSTFAATLVWDREPILIEDSPTINGRFDATFDSTTGLLDFREEFVEPSFEEQTFNSLDLYLMPGGATDIAQAVTSSESFVMNLEHIFFDVELAGMYEIWVVQRDNYVGPMGGDQLYALAWWADTGITIPTAGDFDGDGTIGQGDYNAWAASYGATVTAGTGADGNGDGIVDAADYTVWRDNYNPASTAVPEPATALLVLVGLLAVRAPRLAC
jgi:hypothetical protein